jgi:hypothetical protein
MRTGSNRISKRGLRAMADPLISEVAESCAA